MENSTSETYTREFMRGGVRVQHYRYSSRALIIIRTLYYRNTGSTYPREIAGPSCSFSACFVVSFRTTGTGSGSLATRQQTNRGRNWGA